MAKRTGAKLRIPKLCLHKSSGRGYVTNPRTHKPIYLGDYGSDECERNYREWVGRWRALGAAGVDLSKIDRGGPTVAKLIVAFLAHAKQHYVKDGQETSEVGTFRVLLAPLNNLYGRTKVADFKGADFRAVRQQYIEAGLSRGTINDRAARLRRVFRWGVAEDLVPPDVLAKVSAVEPLQKGRTPAPEREKVKPVPKAHFEAAVAQLREKPRLMAQLHYLLGCRPGEVVVMRPADIDRTQDPWLYRPIHYKTEHHESGKPRDIFIGKEAQAILRPLLERQPTAWVFWSRARGIAHGKGPGHYTVQAYWHLVKSACLRAGVPHWNPNQVRHLRLTEVRRAFGLEAAQAVGGHADPDMTARYAERLENLARTVAKEMG